MEEQELIFELKQGNTIAFKRLFEAYGDVLYNTVLSIVQQEQSAEDVVQETFIQVYDSIRDFRAGSTLKTWMHSIAIRKAIDVLRKEKNRSRFGKFLPFWMPDDTKSKDSLFHHPGAKLEQKETAALLFKAISTLPEKQRVAFSLIKVQEMSYKEAAEILDESVKAIESLVSRAKKNLQNYLSDYYKQ